MQIATLLRSGLGRRLAIATISSGAVWAAGTAATFVVGVLLARRLGPSGYGVYGTAMAVITLLSVPAQLGLPLLATREVSATRVRGRPNDVAALGWSFTAMVIAVSILLAVMLRLAVGLLPFTPAIRHAITSATGLLPALALSGLTTGLLRGQEQVVGSQLLDVLLRPILFIAALMLWSYPLGPSQALTAQTIAAGTVALVGLVLFFRDLPLRATGGALHFRRWAASSLPMTLLDATRALEGSYAVLIASYAVSITDAGLLRVAMASSVIASLPLSVQTIVTGPHLASAHAASEHARLARIVAASTLFMTAAVGVVTLMLSLMGRWAVSFAFGSGFAGAYAPLLVLSGNQFLAALLGPNIMLLSMTGEERIVARTSVVAAVAAVIAAILLTPIFGVVGTASSALVATTIRGVVLNRRARQRLGISPSLLGSAELFNDWIGRTRTT